LTDLPLVADDFPAALTEAVRLTDTVLDKLLVRTEGGGLEIETEVRARLDQLVEVFARSTRLHARSA